jgi:hypothetical protein
VEAEGHERVPARWHCMVREVASNDLPQPLALLGNWLVHPPPQLLLYLLDLCPHAVASGFPLEEK